MALYLNADLRNEIRIAIRESGWSDGHRRRVYRWLAALQDGRQPECRTCLAGTGDGNHECLQLLIGELDLDTEAEEHFFKSVLAPGEILDSSWTEYLSSRGPYWVDKLSDDYKINVRGGTDYTFIAATPLTRSPYAYTDSKAHLIVINSKLFDAGADVADMYLVHMLIHGSGCKDGVHGPEFRKRLASVYPWDDHGPATEYDSGSTRKDLFKRAVKAVPLP